MSPAVASTASSQQRRVLQVAALALRILFRLGTDAALYGYLFTFWAGFFGGFIMMSFGYRVCGEGSTVQALGEALLSPSLDLLERFFPAFALLFVVRIIHIAYVSACADEPPAKEKERYMGKKSGLGFIIDALANGRYLALLGDKNFSRNTKLPRYAVIILHSYILVRAITIQLNLGKGWLGWRVIFAFCDTATFCFLFLGMFLTVREIALFVALPRERDVFL